MASAPSTPPDALITLKVQQDGITKKLKLPLRDLGASALEDKLRAMLDIGPHTVCRLERYSDSQASYVLLDRSDVSVYKQLYRAAKAKQKLKLRVTTSPQEFQAEARAAPKPVTIEDVPETSEPADQKPVETSEKPVDQKPLEKTEKPLVDPLSFTGRAVVSVAASVAAAAAEPPRPPPRWQFAPETPLDAQLNNMARSHEEFEKSIAHIEASVAKMNLRNHCLPASNAPMRSMWAEPKRETHIAQPTALYSAWDTSYIPLVAPPRPDKVRIVTPTRLPVEKTAIETPASASAGTPGAARTTAPVTSAPCPSLLPILPAAFNVCCNSCDRNIPDSHYHCSTCDEGDFDLCQDCVDMGITCFGNDHWLIKRFTKNGTIINSTTERIAPKRKVPKPEPTPAPKPAAFQSLVCFHQDIARDVPSSNVRTCNNCVGDMPEAEFLHCTTCFDFDLCKTCFVKNDHGHHPKHGFVPAVEGTALGDKVSRLLAPGRSQMHNAVCDGCEKFILGVRHKCLDCPDWDYCSDCVVNAGFIHPNHRFVPIYEAISEIKPQLRGASKQVHYGICCDGPLCTTSRGGASYYIVGERYKCAVCDNTDFCANCEASPANTHNKTHPLIKFKTPVRHVSVTTTGEHEDGKRMPTMGDRVRQSFASSQSRATETTQTSRDISINSVQTVVNVEPTEAEAADVEADVKDEPKPEVQEVAREEEVIQEEPIKEEKAEAAATAPATQPSVEDLVAVYESDTVADGTVLPPNHVFEQTWVLRNAGTVAWPAGCRVKFVSGDYMGHVDPNHPARIQELVSASETTICYSSLAPGDEFAFTVLLRTPARFGKAISYWRLTTEEGAKFGHRLWCDIEVQPTKVEQTEEPKSVAELAPEEPSESRLVIPTLEKESPVASIHQDVEQELASIETTEQGDELDDLEDDDEWIGYKSDDAFLTDDEYDILDASDEEYLEDQQKKLHRK